MRKSFEVQSCSSLINRARRLSSRALAMDYSKNDFAGFKSRVPANWLRGETLASIFVIVSSSAAGRFTQNGSVSAVTLESLWHRGCSLSQRENSKRGEKSWK